MSKTLPQFRPRSVDRPLLRDRSSIIASKDPWQLSTRYRQRAIAAVPIGLGSYRSGYIPRSLTASL